MQNDSWEPRRTEGVCASDSRTCGVNVRDLQDVIETVLSLLHMLQAGGSLLG